MVETPQEDSALAQEVWARLPPWEEAVTLTEAYLAHGRYSWSTLPRAELCGMYMSGIYAHPKEMRTAPRTCWSGLSLLFAVFALGALFEPPATPPSPPNPLGSPSSPHNLGSNTTPPPIHPTAHAYFRTARAALALAQPMVKTTATGVLTLVHLAQWLEHAQAYGELTMNGGVPGPTGEREIVPAGNVGGGASGWVWAYMGLAARLGTSIGLHLNSARWKLDEQTAQRRSRIFWQLFTHDTWVSFSFGRPPSLNASFIDCALPKDEDEYTNNQGGKELGFHSWTWQYARLLHNVMTTAFGAKVPPYTMVLDLDRKIRDFPVPSYLQPNCNELEMPSPTQELIIQRFIVLSSKEATLLNLHRTYFAQALREQPHDLLRHRYGPSVMATYRSAWRLIEGLKSPTRRTPGLIARHNIAWSNALSAAIVMCLMVTRAPSSNLATSCMEELVTVEGLFTAASPSCRAAANLLESIKRLRIKGQEALDQSHSSDPLLTPAELDRLGGKTYYISGGSCIAPDSASPATTSDSDASLEEPGPMPTDFIMMDNLHPRIVQDMKAFEFEMSMPTYNLSQQTPYSGSLFDAPPVLDPQAMTQDAGIYGVDLFPFMAERLMQQQYQQQMQQPQHGGEQPAAPIEGAFSPNPAAALDATWQSFVEQLGF
ncbi:hypothetical protein FIBSPDRAFT_1054535 [Athelia psychrophila]|uniref:Xylanolytic transcriptional activator regulatory domain-containing protein n=1 Tax=Athelia psychrophila TaxID=1759441 RepID=A0A167V5V5_9AGAM|nr:hypothetical protein FIBSPDRAFT_1054535 [Fibularhizoctonia sp. CBS 109695]